MKKNKCNHYIPTLKDRDINYEVLTQLKGGNLNIPACLSVPKCHYVLNTMNYLTVFGLILYQLMQNEHLLFLNRALSLYHRA